MKTIHWKILEIDDHIGQRIIIKKDDEYFDSVLIHDYRSRESAIQKAKEIIEKTKVKTETLIEEIIQTYEN